MRTSANGTTRILLLAGALLACLTLATAQPSPHGKLEIPCTDCHTTTSWKELASPMVFSHATTRFELQGKHATAGCIQCHAGNKFSGTPSECYDCHEQDFTDALVPNHMLGIFSHDCIGCHSLIGWKPSVFQHAKTNFQLLGAHLLVDCASCHTNNRYAGLSSDCYSCHQSDFTRSTTANHVTGQFSHDCTGCHSMASWKPVAFDHQKTSFPLLGAHQTLDCAACHKSGQPGSISAECFSCHQADFSKSTTVNHVTGQFSHDCTICHSMAGWKPATFTHTTVGFPLTGAHATTACIFCHKNGQFAGTPADCYSCHAANFTGATNPNHVTGGFDHTCSVCHATTAWSPATFDHAKTAFPLTGAHLQTACVKCHVGGTFASAATDCYSCHTADFAAAKSPDHAAGQYPHDCTTCHSTSAWQPSTFNHDAIFRIASNHRNSSCTDCHRTAGAFQAFSCTTGCHGNAHNQNQPCYPCHTR